MHDAFPPDVSDPPFALAPELFQCSLNLPCPPSVNRTRRKDGAGARLLQKFYKAADMHVLAQRGRSCEPLAIGRIKGPFEAHIVISDKLTGIDLDNGVKAILDYAVRIELVPDDGPKYLRRLVVEWGVAIEGCRLTLREMAG